MTEIKINYKDFCSYADWMLYPENRKIGNTDMPVSYRVPSPLANSTIVEGYRVFEGFFKEMRRTSFEVDVKLSPKQVLYGLQTYRNVSMDRIFEDVLLKHDRYAFDAHRMVDILDVLGYKYIEGQGIIIEKIKAA